MVSIPIIGGVWPHLRFAVSFQGGYMWLTGRSKPRPSLSFGLYFDQVEDSVNFTISTSAGGNNGGWMVRLSKTWMMMFLHYTGNAAKHFLWSQNGKFWIFDGYQLSTKGSVYTIKNWIGWKMHLSEKKKSLEIIKLVGVSVMDKHPPGSPENHRLKPNVA